MTKFLWPYAGPSFAVAHPVATTAAVLFITCSLLLVVGEYLRSEGRRLYLRGKQGAQFYGTILWKPKAALEHTIDRRFGRFCEFFGFVAIAFSVTFLISHLIQYVQHEGNYVNVALAELPAITPSVPEPGTYTVTTEQCDQLFDSELVRVQKDGDVMPSLATGASPDGLAVRQFSWVNRVTAAAKEKLSPLYPPCAARFADRASSPEL